MRVKNRSKRRHRQKHNFFSGRMRSSDFILIAQYLEINLKKHGVVVQRYDSKTSTSIYMKIDYGLGGSIRISDHISKRDLSHRYNVLDNCTKKYCKIDRSGNYRFFYPLNKKEILLNDILEYRKIKMEGYTEEKYFDYMKESQQRNKNNKGFWESSKTL